MDLWPLLRHHQLNLNPPGGFPLCTQKFFLLFIPKNFSPPPFSLFPGGAETVFSPWVREKKRLSPLKKGGLLAPPGGFPEKRGAGEGKPAKKFLNRGFSQIFSPFLGGTF